MHAYVCGSMHATVDLWSFKGQLSSIKSFLPLCDSREWNSGSRAWQEVPSAMSILASGSPDFSLPSRSHFVSKESPLFH